MKKILSLAILGLVCISSQAFARNGFGNLDYVYTPNYYQKPTSFYNSYGTYQGQAKPNCGGGYDIYNNIGTYQGHLKPNYYGGYDTYNSYGTITGYSR